MLAQIVDFITNLDRHLKKKKFHTKRGIRAAHDFRIQRHLQENKGTAHSHLFCKSVSAQHAWGL